MKQRCDSYSFYNSRRCRNKFYKNVPVVTSYYPYNSFDIKIRYDGLCKRHTKEAIENIKRVMAPVFFVLEEEK